MAVLALDIKSTQVGRKKRPVTVDSRDDGRLRKDSTPQVTIFPYNVNNECAAAASKGLRCFCISTM